MKWDFALRAVGILGIVLAYAVFTIYGETQYPLVIAIIGIIALVSPEAIDALPFGPTK
jgi:hypothetical protein